MCSKLELETFRVGPSIDRNLELSITPSVNSDESSCDLCGIEGPLFGLGTSHHFDLPFSGYQIPCKKEDRYVENHEGTSHERMIL